MQEINNENLTKEEKQALVEFLKSLTSSNIDQLIKPTT